MGDVLKEVLIDEAENAELEVENPDLGTEIVTGADFSASIGDELIGVSVSALFERRKQPLPEGYAAANAMYELWLIPHRVGIVRLRGLREVMKVTVDAQFDVGKKTCSIVDLFPASEHVELGSLTASTGFDVAGKVSANAGVVVDPIAMTSVKLGAGFTSAGSLKFETKITTPKIQTNGHGGRHATWVFARHDKPLYGEVLDMWSLILLPRRPTMKKLKYSLTVTLTHRVAFFPTVWRSKATEVNCTLVRDF